LFMAESLHVRIYSLYPQDLPLTDTAYDLKLVIDKGTVDVLKPSWIIHSIEQGEKVPMKKKYDSQPKRICIVVDFLVKRYFFHATDARQATDDYDLQSDEENELHPPSLDEYIDIDVSMLPVDEKVATPKEEELDPELAEWLKIDEKRPASTSDVDDDSVTEADSDNADVAVDSGEVGDDLDDWFQVEGKEGPATNTKAAGKQPEMVVRLHLSAPYSPGSQLR